MNKTDTKPDISPLLFFIGIALALAAVFALVIGCSPPQGAKIVSADHGKLTITDDDELNRQTHEVAPNAEVTLDGRPAEFEDLSRGDQVDVKIENRKGKDLVTEINARSKELTEDDAANNSSSGRQPADRPVENRTKAPFKQPLTPPKNPLTPLPSDNPWLDDHPPLITPELQVQNPNNERGSKSEKSMEQTFEGNISKLDEKQFEIAVKDAGLQVVLVSENTKITLDGEQAELSDLDVDDHVRVTASADGDKMLAKTVDAKRK